jgi:hypothetical protein
MGVLSWLPSVLEHYGSALHETDVAAPSSGPLVSQQVAIDRVANQCSRVSANTLGVCIVYRSAYYAIIVLRSFVVHLPQCDMEALEERIEAAVMRAPSNIPNFSQHSAATATTSTSDSDHLTEDDSNSEHGFAMYALPCVDDCGQGTYFGVVAEDMSEGMPHRRGGRTSKNDMCHTHNVVSELNDICSRRVSRARFSIVRMLTQTETERSSRGGAYNGPQSQLIVVSRVMQGHGDVKQCWMYRNEDVHPHMAQLHTRRKSVASQLAEVTVITRVNDQSASSMLSPTPLPLQSPPDASGIEACGLFGGNAIEYNDDADDNSTTDDESDDQCSDGDEKDEAADDGGKGTEEGEGRTEDLRDGFTESGRRKTLQRHAPILWEPALPPSVEQFSLRRVGSGGGETTNCGPDPKVVASTIHRKVKEMRREL